MPAGLRCSHLAGLPRALPCRRRQSGHRRDLRPGTRDVEAGCQVDGATVKPPGPCLEPVHRSTTQSLWHWDAATSVHECQATGQERLVSGLAECRRSAPLRRTECSRPGPAHFLQPLRRSELWVETSPTVWSRQPCLVATGEDPCGNGSELM